MVKEILSWGYKHVFILDKGYAGWLKKDGAIQRGMVRTKIFYLPRPHPGEIVGDEFMNIVNSKPNDKLIVDVRTPAEMAYSILRNGGFRARFLNDKVAVIENKLYCCFR